jgi:NAD-dependent oxidoreductase involved in siderophore biosynthesis
MIKVGVIGYGYWGPNLARNLADTDGVEVTAIADGRPERRAAAARRHPGTVLTADAASLMARDDLDAVAIATPLHTHYTLASAAIERGKHVLVEKPLAASARDAESLGELAEKRGVRLMVDHTFVYTGAVRAIRRLGAAGRFALSGFGSRQPRVVPAGQQRHLGSGHARSVDHGLSGRRPAGRGLRRWHRARRLRSRKRRLRHGAL